jgi:anti-sigma regulatory factor (Ser/Thr protein kinase)
MRVARLIQQTLLPRHLPDLPGWKVSAYYQPARAVGGDFYDFMVLPDGRLGIFVGDVTDKGVPAALVMATKRSVLRSAANQYVQPGKVLEYANNILYPDIPSKMFITCLYAILNPVTGWMQYANAGHNLPYRCNGSDLQELRVTGMPLGLMPDMHYEEKETGLSAGDSILLYSDGLTEAHNPQRDMYGFGRVKEHICGYSDGDTLIKVLLEDLSNFTGSGWEQEDDLTMVTLHCSYLSPGVDQNNRNEPCLLTKFDVESQPGNERLAMEQVCDIVEPLKLPNQRLDRLKTAVAEATMNAMEHGNQYQKDKPVTIEVISTERLLSIRVTDHGGSQPIPERTAPDLEAKLAGLQSSRGWGLFLIQKMVDETHHTVELVFYLQDDENGAKTFHH